MTLPYSGEIVENVLAKSRDQDWEERARAARTLALFPDEVVRERLIERCTANAEVGDLRKILGLLPFRWDREIET